ncbi:hypothetical protein [Spirillospora sp. CA-294931]|uniref:hypothetical protein n=1 Tax=Spirillospora sp. CA-294931 TaxID=3240042 RepID=UPI003D90E29A
MIRTLAAGVPAAVLAAGLLSACGGEETGPKVATLNSGAPSTAAAVSKAPAEQGKEFAECLRQQGLKVEDPDAKTGRVKLGGAGADKDTMRKAMQACRSKMPQGARDQGPPDAAKLEMMRKLAQCMRDEGVDMPDPGPKGFDFGKIDRTAPGFADASRKCQEKYPTLPKGGR